MMLLLDTHAVAWWFLGDERMNGRVRRLIEDNDGPTYASAVSAFEMAQKHRLGKWPAIAPLVRGFDHLVTDSGMLLLPLMPAHAIRAVMVPSDHRDPFDRMLAGQALVERLTLVSKDGWFRELGMETVWG